MKRLKEEARRKHAVAVIWAYWLGLKVLPSRLPPALGEPHKASHLLTPENWRRLLLSAQSYEMSACLILFLFKGKKNMKTATP